MALEDLDLEFEDDDLVPAKKVAEKAIDRPLPEGKSEGTLEFKVDMETLKSASEKPQTLTNFQIKNLPVSSLPETQILPNPLAQSAQRPQKSSEASRVGVVSPLKKQDSTSSVTRPEKTETQILREQLRQTQFNADVSSAAAEFKIQLLGEVLGDMKLLEHQVNQILARISAKNPDVKQEALLIKKILADFTSKKRK